MNQLKISTRFLLLGGFMSALLVVLAGLGLYGMRAGNLSLQSVYEDRTVPISQLGQIENMLLANRLALAVAIGTPTPEVVEANAATIDANIASISKLWDAYTATKMTPREAELVKTATVDRQRFVQEGLKPAIAALRANDVAAAQTVVEQKIRPLYTPFKSGIEALIKLQVDEVQAEYKAAESRYQFISQLCTGNIIGTSCSHGTGTYNGYFHKMTILNEEFVIIQR